MNQIERHSIAVALGDWYSTNQRSLPWRETKDPYKIWLSEVILQQTQVIQGTPYYLSFIHHFPKVQNLANAAEDDVLKLWQGLGYYSRARNLHSAAKQIVTDFSGVFPDTYPNILKLKGVGPYTAAAIASIAFGEERAVIDGNVIRVITRLFGIREDVNSIETKKQIQSISDLLIQGQNPGEHNQALMEFGAIQCVPKNPVCDNCPLSSKCNALGDNKVSQLPLKTKKTKRRSRFFHFILITDQKRTLIEKRKNGDIWTGLYQFPLIELESDEIDIEKSIKPIFTNLELQHIKSNKAKKHVLSHQDIHATFHHFYVSDLSNGTFQVVKLDEVHTFALPRLIDRYLEVNEF